MKKISLLVVAMLVLAGLLSWYPVPTVLASCAPNTEYDPSTVTSVSPGNGTVFTNPSSIFISASGETSYQCAGEIGGVGFGVRSTLLSWNIKDSGGNMVDSSAWHTPSSWNAQTAYGPVPYDTSLFANGYSGENVDVIAWPAGGYVLTYSTSDASMSANFTITRPAACTLSATCVPNANTTDTLTVITSNCSSASIDGSAISPTNGTYVNASKTYGIYVVKADSLTSNVTCPPQPSLLVTGGGSMTVTPGQANTSPGFNFSNNGDTGSVIKNAQCYVSSGDLAPSAYTSDCSAPRDLVK